MVAILYVPENAVELIELIPEPNVTVVNAVHPLNVSAFMVVKLELFGIVMDVILQFSNADEPMEVTEDGIVIAVKLALLHPLNAELPMVINAVPDIVMDVNPVQFSSADTPMEVTVFGIVIVVNLEHPLNVLSLILVTELGIVMDGILLFSNADEPMEVTEDGIVIAVKLTLLHPLNAELPMVINAVPDIVMDVNPEQLSNALLPTLVIKLLIDTVDKFG